MVNDTRHKPKNSDHLERQIEALEIELDVERRKRQQVEKLLSHREQDLTIERQKRRLLERELRAREGREAKLLSLFHPADYLRLLWWVLFSPVELNSYRVSLNAKEFDIFQRQVSWLVSSLLWWPIFIWVAVPWLLGGLVLNNSSASLILLGIIFAWVVVGLLGVYENGLMAFAGVIITAVITLVTIAITSGIVDVDIHSLNMMLWGGVLVMVCSLMAISVAAINRLEIAEIVAGVVAVVVAGGVVLTLFNSSANWLDVVIVIISAALLAGVAQERYKRIQFFR